MKTIADVALLIEELYEFHPENFSDWLSDSDAHRIFIIEQTKPERLEKFKALDRSQKAQLANEAYEALNRIGISDADAARKIILSSQKN